MPITEISPDELLRALEAGTRSAPQVLDVRAPARAARGHIEAPMYLNVPGSRIFPLRDAAELGLDRARPVAVVCDRGNASREVAELLAGQGFDARSLRGGMLGWMLATASREVPGVVGLDRLVQIDRVGKGALGYFAERSGEALIVDPARNLDPYRELLAERDSRLVAVVDTHCHADYLSGGPALAADYGAPYFLHPADAIDPYTGRAARIPFTPLRGGDELSLGDARFAVEHLPGHTEGSVCLRLGDELALTGDLLFVESVGRPDLAGRTAAWTELLFQSLTEVRARWSPGLRILPAHYAGESERRPSRLVAGLLGELAARNPPFAISDAKEFAAWIEAHTVTFPEQYRTIKQANLGWVDVSPALADELDAGKNQCALGG